MTEIMDGQVDLFDRDTASLKTSPDSFLPPVQTKGRISKRSSRSSSGSHKLTLPTCLCLTRESGPEQDGSTTTWADGAWLGAPTTLVNGVFRRDEDGLLWLQTSTDSQPQKFYLTLNIGEKPRIPNPTKLSQILESNADEKYRLSARACQGILNRAERRGKELPQELKAALTEQASRDVSTVTTVTDPENGGGEHKRPESPRSLGIDHVLISGGTTFQGRGWYDEVSGFLKTMPHGVMSKENDE